MPLLTRKRLILSKIETTYANDSSPAGTDAVLVRNLDVTPLQSDVVSRDLIRPYLGNSQQLLSQTRVAINFEVELAGSGAGGTAPKFNSLLRACGMAQTLVANPVTGSAVAGEANSITLASGASSVDDFYSGMVIEITSGTGSGSSGVITNYVGSTKVATVTRITSAFTPGASSGYSIAASATYKPVSSDFESATIYFNNDGVLHKATGCRGTYSFNCQVGQIPTISFQMTGIYNAPTDTAAPAVTYTAQATPQIFKADNTSLFRMLGHRGCLMSCSFDIANEIIYRELVGCTKSINLVNRAPSGTVMIEAPTIAEKDFFASANSDETGTITLLHGTGAGNQVSFLAPNVDISQPTYSDQDGIQMLNLPYVAIPSSTGNDEVKLVFS